MDFLCGLARMAVGSKEDHGVPLHGIKIEGFLVNVHTKPKKNVTSLKLYSFGRYGPIFHGGVWVSGCLVLKL